MPAWPTSIALTLDTDSMTYKPVSNAIPINVESGEPMSRRRFTGAMMDVRGSLMLTDDEALDIYDFWFTDCNEGATRFTWNDPLSGDACEMMFTDTPTFTPQGSSVWRVELPLRIMPT